MAIVVNNNFISEFQPFSATFHPLISNKVLVVIRYGPMAIVDVYDWKSGNLFYSVSLEYTGNMRNPPSSVYVNSISTLVESSARTSSFTLYRVNTAAAASFNDYEALIAGYEINDHAQESISFLGIDNRKLTSYGTLNNRSLRDLSVATTGSPASASLSLAAAELPVDPLTVRTTVSIPSTTQSLNMNPVPVVAPSATFSGVSTPFSAGMVCPRDTITSSDHLIVNPSGTTPGTTYTIPATTSDVVNRDASYLELYVYYKFPSTSGEQDFSLMVHISDLPVQTADFYQNQIDSVHILPFTSSYAKMFHFMLPVRQGSSLGTVYTVSTHPLTVFPTGTVEVGLFYFMRAEQLVAGNIVPTGTVAVGPIPNITPTGSVTIPSFSETFNSNANSINVPSSTYSKLLPVSGSFTTQKLVDAGFVDVILIEGDDVFNTVTVTLDAAIVKNGK